MSRLRMQAFGGLNVTACGSRPLAIAGSCRPLLGYLLTHRHRPVTKTELAESVWCERRGEHARHCLATALWRLKKSTEANSPLIAMQGPDSIAFNVSRRIWVDVIAMEARLAPLLKRKPETLGSEALQRLERGVRLYRGDYLAGMDHEWARLERQRLRDLYCDGLYQLVVGYADARAWNEVLTWGRCLSREEPLREDVHRMLMLAFMHTGNRASALRQYRHCERLLADDLGVAPMAETQALRQLLASQDADRTGETAVRAAASASGHPVRRRIERTRRLLAVCQHQLDHAVEALDAAPPPQP